MCLVLIESGSGCAVAFDRGSVTTAFNAKGFNTKIILDKLSVEFPLHLHVMDFTFQRQHSP